MPAINLPCEIGHYENASRIDDISPRSNNDEACLSEIRNVLHKHGALQRFGITLLHQHFEVADDEMMIETCDIERRILTIQPVKKSTLHDTKVMETNWRLDQTPLLPGVHKFAPTATTTDIFARASCNELT